MRSFINKLLPLVLGAAALGCGGGDSQPAAAPASSVTSTAAVAPGGSGQQGTAKYDPKQRRGKPHR